MTSETHCLSFRPHSSCILNKVQRGTRLTLHAGAMRAAGENYPSPPARWMDSCSVVAVGRLLKDFFSKSHEGRFTSRNSSFIMKIQLACPIKTNATWSLNAFHTDLAWRYYHIKLQFCIILRFDRVVLRKSDFIWQAWRVFVWCCA